MRKRDARRILNAQIAELASLVAGERLSQKQVNKVVEALRMASCAALALKQRIDCEPRPSSERLHDAE